ncbi:hypothetical protein D3C74_311740 [compost metagenome]
MDQRAVLANVTAAQYVLLTARQYPGRTVEERVFLLPEQQPLFTIRENIQITVDQVHIVGPVIRPITFAEGSFDLLLGER